MNYYNLGKNIDGKYLPSPRKKKKKKNKFGKIARILHLVGMESLPFNFILAKILAQRVQRRAK